MQLAGAVYSNSGVTLSRSDKQWMQISVNLGDLCN